MYDELIEQMRSRASWLEFAIIKTPSKTDGNGDAILFRKAADAIEDLIVALTASNEVIAKSKQQWISVTERLPEEDYEPVLTCDERGNIHIMQHSNRYKYPFGISPTHSRYFMPKWWMPLPEPPKDGEE